MPESVLLRMKPPVGDAPMTPNSPSKKKNNTHTNNKSQPILLNSFEIALNCGELIKDTIGSFHNNEPIFSKNTLLKILLDAAESSGLLEKVLTERDHRD